VISIEPDQDTFRCLRQGIKLNKFRNVLPLNFAAWDEECFLELHGSRLGKGLSLVKRKSYHNRQVVPAFPLDKVISELGLSRISYIKIDAEGSEYEILQGARELLSRYKPKIIVEITMNRDEIFKFLENMNYTVKQIESNKFYFYCEPRDKVENARI